MKILQEGLHTYQVKEEVKNTYYLSVEYGVLKRNSIKMLLPVQLREQDGKQGILFDITGKQSLKEFKKEQGFSFQESRKLVQGLVSLIREIDDYMLDFECVSLCPEYTFVEDGSGFQWMYLPDDKNDVQKAAEDFFSWMLTRMDYENARGVMFAYAVFDAVRKHGFSEQLLRKCLEKYPEDYGREESMTKDSPEDYGREESMTKDSPEDYGREKSMMKDSPEDYERKIGMAEDFPVCGDGMPREKGEILQGGLSDGRSGRDGKEGEDWQSKFSERESEENRKEKSGSLLRRGMVVLQVIFLILSAGAAVSVGALILGGVRFGFSLIRYRYIVGCSIFTIVFLMMAYQLWKKRRKISETGKSGRKERKRGEVEKSEWTWEDDTYEQERNEKGQENEADSYGGFRALLHWQWKRG